MTDLVKRLRAKPPKGFVLSPLMIEAADEIERLRRLNSEYREALEYIADMPDGWEEDEELNLLFVVDNHVNVARDVLLGPLANDKDCV